MRCSTSRLPAILSFSVGTLACLAYTFPAAAGGGGTIPCGSAPGIVREASINPASFTVTITNPTGGVRVPQPAGFPAFGVGVLAADGLFRRDFNIPAFPFACDVKNRTIPGRKRAATSPPAIRGGLVSAGGEAADLSLEAVVFDPTSGAYSLEDLFGRLRADVGLYAEVDIPDLYADTNGDGVLDSG